MKSDYSNIAGATLLNWLSAVNILQILQEFRIFFLKNTSEFRKATETTCTYLNIMALRFKIQIVHSAPS